MLKSPKQPPESPAGGLILPQNPPAIHPQTGLRLDLFLAAKIKADPSTRVPFLVDGQLRVPPSKAQKFHKWQEEARTVKFPSVQRRCRYCKLMFATKPTYNGSRMKFCTEAHRKAFDKYGETPIEGILRKQERKMREIARQEYEALFRPEALTLMEKLRAIAREEALVVLQSDHHKLGELYT